MKDLIRKIKEIQGVIGLRIIKSELMDKHQVKITISKYYAQSGDYEKVQSILKNQTLVLWSLDLLD